jgi:hypothetical protein
MSFILERFVLSPARGPVQDLATLEQGNTIGGDRDQIEKRA